MKRRSFPPCIISAPLSNISWLYRHGFITGLLILFHWSRYSFLFQNCTVLISTAKSCTAEEARCSFTSSRFPHGRNHRPRSSDHWAVPPWGRGNADKVKLPLTFFNVLNLDFFFFLQQCAGNSPLVSWTSTKSHQRMSKLVLFGRRMEKKNPPIPPFW